MKIRLFITGLLMTALMAAAKGDDPTFPELQKMFKDKQYQVMLQKIAQILKTPREAAKAYNMHELYTLKAEGLLRMKDGMSAAEAFEDAAKAAGEDGKEQAMDRATMVLLRRSQKLQYTPKQSKGAPIDVIEPASRQSAIEALFKDELVIRKSKIQSALKGRTLPPIAEAIQPASELAAMEMAATGSESEASKMLKDLSRRAEELMGDKLKDMTKRENALTKLAAQETRYQDDNGQWYWERRGLEAGEIRELEGMIQECKQIGVAAGELETKLGSMGRELGKISKDAEKELHEMDRLMNDNFAKGRRRK